MTLRWGEGNQVQGGRITKHVWSVKKKRGIKKRAQGGGGGGGGGEVTEKQRLLSAWVTISGLANQVGKTRWCGEGCLLTKTGCQGTHLGVQADWGVKPQK